MKTDGSGEAIFSAHPARAFAAPPFPQPKVQIMQSTSLLIATTLILLAGCATEPSQPPAPAMASATNISVVFDCGACTVSPKVSDLIRSAYSEAAAKAKTSAALSGSVTLTVKEYVERSGTTRVLSLLAGPLAFALKDEIKGVVTVNGRQVPVEYTQRMPFRDIESVAQRIGELSFAAVISTP